MFTPNTFRQRFPEFRDPEVYSDDVLGFWSGIASNQVNAARWGSLTDYGVSLCTAHHLVLAEKNRRANAVGGLPGAVSGPLSSKTVDKVSASYDTSAVSLADAGYWGLTTYGLQLLQMMRMMGAGGLQL